MRHRAVSRQLVPAVAGLESRALLSAVPHHVQALARHAAYAPHVITGTVQGSLTYPPSLTSSTSSGLELIQAQGKVHGSATTASGQDNYQETSITSRLNADKISNGHLTLTDAQGSTVEVTYSGRGISQAKGSGHYNDVLTGTARVNAGSSAGLSYKFVGHSSGTSTSVATGTIKLSFVMVR